MIRWKHMPVALAPTPDGDDQDGCFTGSAVDDRGTATVVYTAVKSVAPDQATLRDSTHNFLETQCLATSSDSDLRTWKKLSKPVLLPPREPGLTGFRDPCLWRTDNTWFMGIGSGIKGAGGRALLYRSKNLRDWEYLHQLASGKRNGKQTNDSVDAGEMCECPDFFALGKKHVLLYCTERKVYWESGELDPKELVFHQEKRGLLDYGAFYAPKSQLDASGRRILWGWITETRPETEYSAAGWAGCMSLPRVPTLAEDGTLRMAVIPEMAKLREKEMSVLPKTGGKDRLETLRGLELKAAAAEIELRFRPGLMHLAISDGVQDIVRVVIDPTQNSKELQIEDHAASFAFTHDAAYRLHIFKFRRRNFLPWNRCVCGRFVPFRRTA
jgi:beta-fructofuranosidase